MILIIGYGNPLRQDDGVGPQVIERLKLLFHDRIPGEVEVMARHQLTPELVEPISRASYVIFIDAAERGEPGEIMEIAVEHSPTPQPFTHNLTPAALMQGACSLYHTCPDAMLYSIAGKAFGYGERLSYPVRKALPTLLKIVYERVESCTNTALSRS